METKTGVLLAAGALAIAGVAAVNTDITIKDIKVNNLVKATLEKIDAKDSIAGIYAFNSTIR